MEGEGPSIFLVHHTCAPPSRLASPRPDQAGLGYGCGCNLAKPYLFGERCLLAVYIFSYLKRCCFVTSIGYHWTPIVVGHTFKHLDIEKKFSLHIIFILREQVLHKFLVRQPTIRECFPLCWEIILSWETYCQELEAPLRGQ